MSKAELDAANESADQKKQKIVKGIIDPTPGLIIDDQWKSNEQNLVRSCWTFTKRAFSLATHNVKQEIIDSYRR